MPRIRCHSDTCESEDTYATYECDPCGPSGSNKTVWEEPAEGPDPDGSPYNRPCPGCSTDTAAKSVRCGFCEYEW